MKVISVNVGLPRQVMWKGKLVTTGIFKEPVAGQVKLSQLNFEGDRQADLSVHGGLSKAVYVYPADHYPYWRELLPEMNLPWGMFGENLTTEGLLEEVVYIGDRFRLGTAEVMVTEPRLPCYKLGLKFGRADIVKKFLASGRSGFYLAVLKEGMVGAGGPIEPLSRDPHGVTVSDIVRLYINDKANVELLRRAVQVEALPEGWRNYFVEQLYKVAS